MRYFALTILITLSAVSPCQAQDTCRLSDGSYWACAANGRLAHVYPESTVVVKTGAEGFAMTAVHFDEACQRYGWAAGADEKGHAIILRTIDGGRNWHPVCLPVLPEEAGNKPMRIHSIKVLQVLLVFDNGLCLRSVDTGCTFDETHLPPGAGGASVGSRFDEMIRRLGGR